MTISSYETAKDIWDKLNVTYEEDKKHKAYVSWENEDDSSTDSDDDEVANICLMANDEEKPGVKTHEMTVADQTEPVRVPGTSETAGDSGQLVCPGRGATVQPTQWKDSQPQSWQDQSQRRYHLQAPRHRLCCPHRTPISTPMPSTNRLPAAPPIHGMDFW
ncbi:hypothetical protein PIB30_036484 [Stylosanthes scabra]|uniref:Uncharacterized protein n=1 Tax=Stylosanthes scabra TaxID=79078 RepID=A0ABU6XCK7_9FABA|nr:hypothetical protein [Stylosanthes scabra]